MTSPSLTLSSSLTKLSDIVIPLAEQRLARSALSRFVEPVSRGKGRLLYLVGPAGSGKSTLIQEFSKQRPNASVLTATEFAAQLAEASESQKLPEFQERFRSKSVFICEDIHSLNGRTQSLQQLLAIVDELLAHGQDIIVSSTKLPGQLEAFPSKLVNRFRGGIIVTVKLPNADSRSSLLRQFVQQEHVSIARDALALLAESLDISPRELQGLLRQLVGWVETSRLTNSRVVTRHTINRTDVEQFLQDANQNPNQTIRPLDISRAVATEFNVTTAALRSSRRSAALVLPRQCAMWLCRKLCKASYPQLGFFFERQHSSVLHAVRRLESRLADDPQLRQRLTRIQASIKRRA